MSTPNPMIPPGYWQNAAGHLVPEERVEPLDQERDALVRAIAQRARNLEAQLRAYQRQAFADIYAFLELVGDKYDVTLGGAKGNVCLRSFDGRFRVEINADDLTTVGPEIHAAKALVDQCVLRWSEGSNSNLRTLVTHSFQTDKKGRFNIGRLLTLARVELDDPEWKRAAQAIKDSIEVVTTKKYLRISERADAAAPYVPIVLNIAGLT